MRSHLLAALPLILVCACSVGMNVSRKPADQPDAAVEPPDASTAEGVPARASGPDDIPDCLDGFGEIGYYDSTKHDPALMRSGIHLPKEAADRCFAIETFGDCGRSHRYELRGDDGELRAVTSEEFFKAIEEKNKACGGCVKEVAAGPG